VPTTISADQFRDAVAQRIGRSKVELFAPVSSRLGRDPQLHSKACRFLSRSMLDARGRSVVAIAALGSAIEPWALRAAELFGVPVVKLAIDHFDEHADLIIQNHDSHPLSRDALVIGLADRVDAVYVRPGGRIASALRQRVRQRADGTTRVAIIDEPKSAAAELIAAGAVGWYLSPTSRREEPKIDDSTITDGNDVDWTHTSGVWLVHCTRSRPTEWPGETSRQYRDSILLGDANAADRQPIDALVRIIRSRRLVGSAVATSAADPVVCFSELPLVQLLTQRCFRPHLGRWDYEPFGVAIRRTAAEQSGVCPVIYGPATQRAALAQQDRFRFQAQGQTFDWRQEQEWRARGSIDLDQLATADVRVFAHQTSDARHKLSGCPWPVTFLSEAFMESL